MLFVRSRVARLAGAGETSGKPPVVIGKVLIRLHGVSFFGTSQWIYMRVAGVPGRAGSQMFIGTVEEPLRCTIIFIES